MIDRRGMLTGLAAGVVALAATPRPVTGQSTAHGPVIGFLGTSSSASMQPATQALLRALAAAGFIEGRSLAVEYRWADNDYERLTDLAGDLVDRGVSLIIAAGGSIAAVAAKAKTSTIPIVFTGVSDPVGLGLVASLARPGGNVTGSVVLGIELDNKRLELLHGIVAPGVVLGALVNPRLPQRREQIDNLRDGAAVLGHPLEIVESGSTATELKRAFDELVERRVRGVVVAADPSFSSQHTLIAGFANGIRLPTIYQWRRFCDQGGLMSYGPRIEDAYEQAGAYAARILKGAKPADLPVVQSAKFELVVNLKTARALDLVLPNAILLRADEVIE